MVPDPVTQKLLAWKIAGWGDRDETMIWMDGRPHPSKYAPHSHGGFTTGTWEGDTLTAVTTHFKLGDIKRHRGFSSDRATLTYRFNRHGDMLTVTGILEDPVYLAEPYVLTEVFRLTTNPNDFPLTACEPIEELPHLHENPALVPHYLPGKHPSMNEVTEQYNIPLEAVLGGPETMYPEYRKTTEGHVRPAASRPARSRRRRQLNERTLLLRHVVPIPGRDLRIAGPRVLRELEVGAVVPLLRQCGRPREIRRVFDGDLVAQPHAILRERQPLDRVLARARRHVQADAGRVGLEGDRIDHERLALPPADGVPVERGLNVGRMLLRSCGWCARHGRPCYRTASRPRLRRSRSCAARRVPRGTAWARHSRAHRRLAPPERHGLPA